MAKRDGSHVEPHHPLQELLGKDLFSIETVPPAEQRRMVNRACRDAVKWHREHANLAGLDEFLAGAVEHLTKEEAVYADKENWFDDDPDPAITKMHRDSMPRLLARTRLLLSQARELQKQRAE